MEAHKHKNTLLALKLLQCHHKSVQNGNTVFTEINVDWPWGVDWSAPQGVARGSMQNVTWPLHFLIIFCPGLTTRSINDIKATSDGCTYYEIELAAGFTFLDSDFMGLTLKVTRGFA